MKNSTLGAAICFIIFLATACKKDNDQAPVDVKGIWRGNMNTFQVMLINKENGKSRFFVSTSYQDTTLASYAWDGNYVKTSKGYEWKFYSDTTVTCVFHVDQLTSQKITGTAFVLQAALEFNLYKQESY